MDRAYRDMLRRIRDGEILSGTCQGCSDRGKSRIHHGLLCGTWCDRCFEKLVSEYKTKSQ